MKLHILSDVHLEFGEWPKAIDINAIDADVTLLAGDIGVGLEGLQWALSIDRPVVYVMGNHEFYGKHTMQELWEEARQCVADTHVHLLENESILIPDPAEPGRYVRFLGATLWTDFCAFDPARHEECMEAAGRAMTDFSTIRVSRRDHATAKPGTTARRQEHFLTPRKTVALHHESRDFLEQALRDTPDPLEIGEVWDKTVVVTHHAPSVKSLAGQQAAAHGDAAYASHLDSLVAEADLWVHGHTHLPVDYCIGPGRVASNPRGYVPHDLVADFKPNLIVEV